MTESARSKLKCGIVMPISAIDGLDKAHWVKVLEILSESITNAGFDADLVSNAADVGIIQKRIIHNLYQNPIVVCDVSGKNPNVMFELGLRLAFDKPTIIVKDDRTPSHSIRRLSNTWNTLVISVTQPLRPLKLS